MTTQATAANPIQVSLVLDGGIFLQEVKVGKNPDTQIGYFSPSFKIYGDWEPIKLPDLTGVTSETKPQTIEVRHMDASNREKTGEVTFPQDLLDHLLFRQELYGSADPKIVDSSFEWVFSFKSGFFRCSSVKDRYFKEMDATHKPTGNRKLIEDMAHDVVVHYELAPGERIEIAVGPDVLWKTSDFTTVAKRFDIEVIAAHATAENYFRDALDCRGKYYWLPNQGDPGPMGGRP